MLKEMGAAVIDADEVARGVMEPGQPAWRDVVAAFGEGILTAEGRIDRRRLGEMVFTNPAQLELLNRSTHPHIINAIKERLHHLEKNGCQYVVVELPLLFEAGLEDMVDEVWVVIADPGAQEERLMTRRGLDRVAAAARIAAQMATEEKAARADVVIDNSNGLHYTLEQVRREWKAFTERWPGAETVDIGPEG